MKIIYSVILTLVFVFIQVRLVEPKGLDQLFKKLVNAAQNDVDCVSTFIDKESGQVKFGDTTRSMRGGEMDSEYTSAGAKDEYWIHPDSKLWFVSSPRRPVKAWHNGLISSFARASQYGIEEKRNFNLSLAKAVANFFMNSFLTPKGCEYGVNRMWDMSGELVTWEELAKDVPNFSLFGVPWFNADRFGVVAAPWIARSGWADMDFLVESFVTLYEVSGDGIYLKVAEDLVSPFINYEEINKRGGDKDRDFCFMVRTDPIGGNKYRTQYWQEFFWSHDAEGALYSFLILAQSHPDEKKAQRYRTIGLRIADLWLKIIYLPLPTSNPGWPPYWMYILDKFLPGKTIEISPYKGNWLKETDEESRTQALGSDFFRINNVPTGLAMAYLMTGDNKYLLASDKVMKWIFNQKNFDKKKVALCRIAEPRPGFFSPHNVHPDSPYMRSSFVLTNAFMSKAMKEAGKVEESENYYRLALDGINSILDDRFKYGGNTYPLYSLEKPKPTFKLTGGHSVPVHLCKNVWLDKKYEAAGLYNEMYGFVYDYLFKAIKILREIKGYK